LQSSHDDRPHELKSSGGGAAISINIGGLLGQMASVIVQIFRILFWSAKIAGR